MLAIDVVVSEIELILSLLSVCPFILQLSVYQMAISNRNKTRLFLLKEKEYYPERRSGMIKSIKLCFAHTLPNLYDKNLRKC